MLGLLQLNHNQSSDRSKYTTRPTGYRVQVLSISTVLLVLSHDVVWWQLPTLYCESKLM